MSFVPKQRAYHKWVELFFIAYSIADDKKMTVFLSVVRGKTYSRLQDLLAPKKPQDKSLPVLFQELKELCEPQLLANHRKKFLLSWINQVANQFITKYIAELQRLATNCDFGEYLNDALRDYLVCGLSDTGIQKRLLSEENLKVGKITHCTSGSDTVPIDQKLCQTLKLRSLQRSKWEESRTSP